ncbi:MAG: c-type cytochrome [Chitinophagales bacterium]|nr:c-type cytochrome [Chitinophagales bacterium]
MKTKTLLSLVLILAFTLSSCLKDNVDVSYSIYTDDEYETLSSILNLPNNKIDYLVKLPAHMSEIGMVSPSIDDAKATLGRVLFYDTKLSKNEAVSCASCHKQELAFSDDKALSEGFEGELTFRNSLALGSVPNFKSSYGGGSSLFGVNQQFFWDERAHSIRAQSVQTIQDDIEMGMDMSELVTRLSGVDYYDILFTKAYGNFNVTEQKITDALEEFINAMVSVNTRFDDAMDISQNGAEGNFALFNAEENLGKALFIQHCSACHGTNMSVSPRSVANNGLEIDYEDKGVGNITLNEEDEGKFKVPFLRNIALTAPYMHDGRFATLEEVVEHYNSGIKPHANLDDTLRDLLNPAYPKRLNLSDDEKDALIAFLHTLTDRELMADAKFADPFK